MNVGSSGFPWESPLLANGRSYLGMASRCDNPSVRGEVRAVDMNSGSQLGNQYFVPSGLAGAGIWNSPALSPDGNTLVVVTGEDYNGYNGIYNRAMVSLDPITLAIQQSFQEGTLGGDLDFGTTPVIFHDSTGRILVGANHKNGVFYTFVLNNINAGPIWTKSTGTSVGMMPAYDPNFGSGGTLFIAGSSGKLYAVDPATGTDRWPFVTLGTMHGNMAVANGLIFVNIDSSTSPSFKILRESDGSTLRTIVPTNAGRTNSGVAVSNGFIYWQSGSYINAWSFAGTPVPTNTPTITNTPTQTNTPTNTFTSTPTRTFTNTATPTNTPACLAYHYLTPEAGGPANGGTVTVGDRFTLDLVVSSGPYTVSSQQAYMTSTYPLLQNVDATQPGCVVSNRVAPDMTVFDGVLQNEVCPGPTPCPHGAVNDPPGAISYASASINNPPYSGSDFRVARVAFCAQSAGTAVIHWLFSPPAPITRDTEIMDDIGNIVNVPRCYVDYVINIVAATATPTAPPTDTPTDTPIPTNTPQANLIGHVVWQGRPAQPNPLQSLPLTLTLRMPGGPIVDFTPTTDNYGFFTVTVGTLPTGFYNWRVKGRQNLATIGSVTLTGSDVHTEMGTQLTGDANNDNCDSALDFSIMKNTFGKSLGDPGYDARADFTGDSSVSIADFSLLKNNFGQCGSPPIP